ncbi:hypothetical protein [Moorena sp. SIO3I6]|uniref:hypothetical protein n=1 Tax=Moorena sp. SIO3I6 TaxID=2607831 RepID=UPI0013FBE43E|nr:hypothetical protein [Moorena sp. SIO3I6]NEP29449.1 hypothetical protein [Moorena sp. SIO3I6]
MSQLCAQCNGFVITIDRKRNFGGESLNCAASATVFSTVESVGRSGLSSAFPLACSQIRCSLFPTLSQLQ